MTQIMTAATSTITAGQIGKLQELLSAGLRKSDFPSAPVQQVIETQGESLVAEMLAALRKRVEAMSSVIVRHIERVNRTRSPKEALNATGRRLYATDEVVATMPRGEGEGAEVHFFKPDLASRGGYISDGDLDKEYESRGLKPADPYSLAAVNEADPAFADDHPNCTHWRDGQGNWCYATFHRVNDERDVNVDRGGNDWDDTYWWFAGVRK